MTPVPAPTQTPQSSIICHWLRICVVSATETVRSASAISTSRRTPQRSIAEAANGPMRPKSAMLMATASEMTARLQPNSSSSGTMSRPGVARMPAVMRSTKNVTAATIQA